jgi:hypothetical protein
VPSIRRGEREREKERKGGGKTAFQSPITLPSQICEVTGASDLPNLSVNLVYSVFVSSTHESAGICVSCTMLCSPISMSIASFGGNGGDIIGHSGCRHKKGLESHWKSLTSSMSGELTESATMDSITE